MWKSAWEKWKRIAAKIAHFQGHLMLSIIYVVIVTPMAVLFKLFGQDPLRMKSSSTVSASLWVTRTPLESATDLLKKEY